ncbi:MAG TPA: tRNA guanosine(34) transglycosylase Tgt [Rhodoblastus sp.]|nr:tRNA guanosine(34) transglycosylase Tgt [Rhodoblastus sp.]
MATDFSYRLIARDGGARLGQISTPRGDIRTPAFMPVGTAATVKAMYPEQVRALGGLHEFMNWPHPILTDSGGFQVMSLAKLRKLDENGVTFQSHIDGAKHVLTPERSMEIQRLLGSDIQMQFDECVKLPCSMEEAERAMRLSLRWAERSRKAFGGQPGRACFGIVQGGAEPGLRIESARALADMDFHGLAIGGLAVGEPQAIMLAMIETVMPHLPEHKPHYLMGVGSPDDLIESVARGIDMFDCVMPTRAGRHGLAYTRWGKINLRNARNAEDPRPLDPHSSCPAARDYSRAYLHHLVRCQEILGMMLLTWVNLAYYQELMAGARAAIVEGRFADYRLQVKADWERGGEPLA